MPTVLMIGAEGAPFAKSGGLGDVLGSLPQALRRQGINAKIMLPKYQTIDPAFQANMKQIATFTVPVSWRKQYCGLFYMEYEGVPVYFIDNEYYFKRSYMYGFGDEAERYAFFCRAVLEALPFLDEMPDLLHCHDWHTGMVSVFLDAFYRKDPSYSKLRTVFTIHNLKYQGVFPKCILENVLGLGWNYFTCDKIEFFDEVNFMKGGIVYSDAVTTVSPTYAGEILTPYYGENLDGLLRHRNQKLYGIINGIDYEKYDPSIDTAIAFPFNSMVPQKKENKIHLQQSLGLNIDPDIPLLAMVSRLVSQKGLDLVERVLDEILSMNIQLVVVGTGEYRFEEMFRNASKRYNGQVSANICFDEALSRRVFAGADLFLMPSQFEPCGIAQLIAMRYGAIPVVRETGGLKDTVLSYNEFTGEGNGFSFTNYNAHDMLFTLQRAVSCYNNKQLWDTLVQKAMSGEFDWSRSAADYTALYQSLNTYEEPHVIEDDSLENYFNKDWQFAAMDKMAETEICSQRE